MILCIMLFMYVAAIQRLNYWGQESRTRNLQFLFLTHLWPWNKIKVIKPTMKMDTLSKIIIMQSWKNLALMMSEKKLTLHTRFTQIILCVTFLMHVVTIQRKSYSGQESQMYNFLFISLTNLWLWNKIKFIKPTIKTTDPQQGYNLAKFKRSRFNGVYFEAFSNEKICQLSPLNMFDLKKKRDLFMIYLTNITII